MSRELLARAWAAGAGPGDAPFTIDLDSTICETYGLAKEGARHHGYTGKRGYHPLLAVAAGTGDVLMSRLREGRANTVRGAAHFLRETVGRVRYAGARGQLTVRADSGSNAHAIVKMDVRYSITIRQHKSLRNLIEAIPETDWTPIPYWMDGAADVAETTYTPTLKPTPGTTTASSPTGRRSNWRLTSPPTPRLRRRDLKYDVGLNPPSRRRRHWASRSQASSPWRDFTRSARRLTLHLGWPWAEQATLALARLRAIPLPSPPESRPSAIRDSQPPSTETL